MTDGRRIVVLPRNYRVTFAMVEEQALRLADADSENDHAYQLERRRLRRMWWRSLKLGKRKVRGRKAGR